MYFVPQQHKKPDYLETGFDFAKAGMHEVRHVNTENNHIVIVTGKYSNRKFFNPENIQTGDSSTWKIFITEFLQPRKYSTR